MQGFLPFFTHLPPVPMGISSTFWLFMGACRFVNDKFRKIKKRKRNIYKISDIAVILPAHNEEMVVRDCIQALKQSLNPDQIYVASDGSVDKTTLRARYEDCHVSNIYPGRGKAKALVYLIKRYKLFERYKLIFIVDADTKIDKNFVKNALPLFNDPQIKVVFGSARIRWKQHIVPKLGYYFISYRERLNIMLRIFFVYGQTWKYANASFVVPGFATIYRSDILKILEIDTPGLMVEDFNLAFQIHKKKLGKIGYHPSLIGWDQHPDNLKDYWKQVKRWNIGFFQTVKKNGFWPSFFWLSLAVFSIEVFIISIIILFIPFLLLYYLSLNFLGLPLTDFYTFIYTSVGPFRYLTLLDVIVVFFVYDYIMTIIYSAISKKPQFLFYGLFFFFMHYVTSLILISSFIPGFFGKSDGRWISPKRLKGF